ncbi:MAG: PA2169 family four-helix-bundle protein [Pseudomonadota bacterium]
MTQTATDALNDLLTTMIDSRQGYEKAIEMTSDHPAIAKTFDQRLSERTALIDEVQAKVRSLGGEPRTEGSASGSAHRAWLSVSSLVRGDAKAALSAVEGGEDHLAEQIEDVLESEELSMDLRGLLQKAHASAKAGEAFAEHREEHL